MAAPKTAAAKVSNTTAYGTVPVPRLMAAPLSGKLASIDPDGCARWQQSQQEIFDQWLQTLNTLNNSTSSSVIGLLRK
jgi:hypothetical protein